MRSRSVILAVVALVWACASSTTVDTSRTLDGGRRDGDSIPRDTGPLEGDAGPATPCSAGETDICDPGCGSTGLRVCSGGLFGPCEPPDETCNGADDDCDGAVDEDVAPRTCSSECGGGTERCVGGAWSGCTAVMPRAEVCDGMDQDCDSMIDEGLTRACTTACGSGTETCVTGTWAGCTARAPAAETCDGTDEDCDGAIDEGFRAAHQVTSYTVLRGRHPGCDGSSQRMGPDCNAAIHRHCGAAMPCWTSGFGPVENAGDRAEVTCVVADVRNIGYAVAATHHPACNAAADAGSTACLAAYHRYCQSLGQTSGFGAVENSGSEVYVACMTAPAAEVVTTTYSTLSTHHPVCDGTTERSGPSCNAAIHRYCRSRGAESGFGPVENSGDTAIVTCVSR